MLIMFAVLITIQVILPGGGGRNERLLPSIVTLG